DGHQSAAQRCGHGERVGADRIQQRGPSAFGDEEQRHRPIEHEHPGGVGEGLAVGLTHANAIDHGVQRDDHACAQCREDIGAGDAAVEKCQRKNTPRYHDDPEGV
nr:hypothetical protein [Tanacetum cinerariifolium]